MTLPVDLDIERPGLPAPARPPRPQRLAWRPAAITAIAYALVGGYPIRQKSHIPALNKNLLPENQKCQDATIHTLATYLLALLYLVV